MRITVRKSAGPHFSQCFHRTVEISAAAEWCEKRGSQPRIWTNHKAALRGMPSCGEKREIRQGDSSALPSDSTARDPVGGAFGPDPLPQRDTLAPEKQIRIEGSRLYSSSGLTEILRFAQDDSTAFSRVRARARARSLSFHSLLSFLVARVGNPHAAPFSFPHPSPLRAGSDRREAIYQRSFCPFSGIMLHHGMAD